MDDDDQNARAIVARVDGDVPLGAASAEDEDGAGQEGSGHDGSGDGEGEAEGRDGGADEPSDSGEEADRPRFGEVRDDPPLARCAAEPMNDIGNGRRLLHRFGDRILHVQRVGWFAYDGRRWAEDLDGEVMRPLAHRVAEAIGREASILLPTQREAEAIALGEAARDSAAAIMRAIAALDGEPMEAAERKRRRSALEADLKVLESDIAQGSRAAGALARRRAARRAFGLASGNTRKLDAMATEALPARSRPLDAFDAEAMKINVLNGTLDIVQVEVEDQECPDPDVVRTRREWRAVLRPHRRDDLIAKLAPVTYAPEATCPTFDAFLQQIQPKSQLREYLLRALGLALTGLDREQCFWLLHGEGRNGKSTLVDCVATLLGDYATTVPIASLVNDTPRSGGQPTPDLNHLPAARFVRSAEPKGGLPLDESLIKQMTGGEPIMLRRLNQESIEVRTVFKLFISVNRKPTIRGDDDGIWRRVHLVPFDVQIDKDKVDRDLPEKLKAELPGILNRLLEGLSDYLTRGGLAPPNEVVDATQDYRDENDDLGRFVREALIVTLRPEDEETAGALYSAYQVWAERAARTPMGKNTFSRRMPATATKAGFDKHKSNISKYIGVRIDDAFRAPAPPTGGRGGKGGDGGPGW